VVRSAKALAESYLKTPATKKSLGWRFFAVDPRRSNIGPAGFEPATRRAKAFYLFGYKLIG
jgi:hypothetical protein